MSSPAGGTPPRTADVVIVGGGVHGASLAYHLARKQAGRIVLVEKKFIASGPTGRSTALVRRFYAMDFFTRTASAAAEIFRHWKDVIGGDGDPGFQQVGMLVLAGPEAAPHLRHNATRARELGAGVTLLTPAEVKALVPAVNVDDVALASYEAESGYADPSSTANALVNRARELGAVIVQYEQVEAIRTAGGRVTGVRTEARQIDAPVVVNCGGLWADRLLRPLGIDIRVTPTRHQMCFFRRPGGFAAHPAIADTVQMTYMRPEHGDLTIHGLLAYHEAVDPDSYNEGADPEQILGNAQRIAHRFPVMEHGLAMGGYSGVYDETPDYQPVMGAVPEYQGLYVDFGWSGHGFKHSPKIGDILSDVILHGKSAGFDLTPFRASRFRENDLLPRAGWVVPPHPKHRLGAP
ncbi:MAG TPA: FAD-binding oxidoreductase [Candidatus Bathyarchaeia archaeon]|nr:FAD-binding oxidoreductase [Candidatus Bathyarchaeia archaeon]